MRAASAAYRQSTKAKLGTEAKTSGMDARYSKNTIRFFATLLCSATGSLAPVARQRDDEPTIKFHGKEYRLLCPEVQTSLPELWSLHPYSITLQACKE
jgi:hypothetical protein